ncbi:MAG: serine/threonine-protein kinase [Mycobacterium sp.]
MTRRSAASWRSTASTRSTAGCVLQSSWSTAEVSNRCSATVRWSRHERSRSSSRRRLRFDAAHRLGVVHRNVKPANLLVTPEGVVYLDDVYSPANAMVHDSSAAETGMNAYRAPELFTSDSWDRRADVYALACVLYRCLTGERPYPSDDLAQLITAHLTAPLPKPSALRSDISVRLDTVIAKGMAKNPDERYSSATELAHAACAAL